MVNWREIEIMIQIESLYKNISDKEILKDINLNVKKGTILGLIGPNGSGKTTLIKCLTGIYKNDKGNIKIDDETVFENAKLKMKMGYIADENNFYKNFKVKNLIDFFKNAYSNFNIERFNELNRSFNIDTNKHIKNLSKGMKMRVSIMLNLSVMPHILIMDEPTSGLDPRAKRDVLNMVLEDVAERKTTVLISSHNLGELERVCDDIAIIDNGHIVFASSLDNMKKQIRKFQVVFRSSPPDNLKEWPEVLDVSQIGRVFYIVTNNYSVDFYNKLKNTNVEFIEEINLSLEDMFMYSTEGNLEVR